MKIRAKVAELFHEKRRTDE